MSEPLVSIPLSLAETILLLAMIDADQCFDADIKQLMDAIEQSKRQAALDQLTQQDQDRYKDTVNPLKRADNG